MDAYTFILQFASEHWFITFCALYVPYLVLLIVSRLITRTLRFVIIAIRGWPPAHLDADGDWNPEQET